MFTFIVTNPNTCNKHSECLSLLMLQLQSSQVHIHVYQPKVFSSLAFTCALMYILVKSRHLLIHGKVQQHWLPSEHFADMDDRPQIQQLNYSRCSFVSDFMKLFLIKIYMFIYRNLIVLPFPFRLLSSTIRYFSSRSANCCIPGKKARSPRTRVKTDTRISSPVSLAATCHFLSPTSCGKNDTNRHQTMQRPQRSVKILS